MSKVQFGKKVIDFAQPRRPIVEPKMMDVMTVVVAMPSQTDDYIHIPKGNLDNIRAGVQFCVNLSNMVSLTFVNPPAVAGPVLVIERGINGVPDIVCHTYILEVREEAIDVNGTDLEGVA